MIKDEIFYVSKSKNYLLFVKIRIFYLHAFKYYYQVLKALKIAENSLS